MSILRDPLDLDYKVVQNVVIPDLFRKKLNTELFPRLASDTNKLRHFHLRHFHQPHSSLTLTLMLEISGRVWTSSDKGPSDSKSSSIGLTYEDIAVLIPYLGQLQKLKQRLRASFAIVVGDRDLKDLEAKGLEGEGEEGATTT